MRKLDRFKKYVLGSAETAVLSHVNADPDAVSSMISMKELLKALKKDVNVKQIAPEGVSRSSSQLISTFKERFETDLSLSEMDLIVLVDTSSPILLGGLEEPFKTFKGNVVVVDHHNPSPDLPRRS
ncbi:MAG: DHH family phosphoesterase, partial [Candidatus Bathyarchaeia archaeon]